VLNQSLEDTFPVLLERGESVAGDGNSSVLIFDSQVSNLNLVKLNLIVILFRLHSFEAHQLVTLSIVKLHVLINTRECCLCG
jgi:hypothetical protein